MRGSAVIALTTALALGLVGCTPAPVDPAAVERWSRSSAAAVEGDQDVLVVLSADISAGRTDELERGAVASTFAGPAQIDALEFSCFGDGTHRLHIPATWRHDVDRVSFGAGDSTADSAWQLVVRGSGGQAD